MRSSHLEDYKTGSFTPAVYGKTTAGAVTGMSRQVGSWIRIGRLVVCNYHIEFTGHTGTGFMLVELPFNAVNADNIEYNVQIVPQGWGTSTHDAASISIKFIMSGYTTISNVFFCRLAGYYPAILVEDITAAGGWNMQGQFSYFTDDAI